MNREQVRFYPASRNEAGRGEYWASLALKHCDALGPAGTKVLLEHFGSARAAMLGLSEWAELELSKRAISCMRKETWRKKARLEWDGVREFPCAVLLWSDPEYPDLLRAIDDPPLFLYFHGDIRLLSNLCVAVVGARNCSVDGRRATVHISRALSASGITIVSGLARGIDRAAHLAGLEHVGGSIAVLGCGLDVPYPKGNQDLRALLGEKGLLLTEYGSGVAGLGRNFIIRNRIISGISRAVLVTEAAPRSGSLNTARHALDQSRELMAVPGATGARHAEGCKELVRRGAKPVFAADDVLRELLPFLERTIQAKVRERDLVRFRIRDDAIEFPDPFPLDLVPGLLPWEAEGERAVEADESDPSRVGQSRSRVVTRTSVRQAQMPPPGQSAPHPTVPDAEMRSGLEKEILFFLGDGSRHIDDICRVLGQNANIVSRLLLQLELGGRVRRLPGMVYTLP